MKAKITSLLVVIVMIFSSCERSELELPKIKEIIKEKPHLEKIKFSEAKDYEYLNYKFKNVAKSSQGGLNNMEIDTTTINFIRTSDYQSYTFRIKNKSALEDRIIQNLVISKSDKGEEFRFYLFEYKLNEDQYLKFLMGENLVDLAEANRIKQLKNLEFDSSLLEKGQEPCYVEITSYEFCSHEEHDEYHSDGTCSHPVRVTEYLEATCQSDEGSTGGGNVLPDENTDTSGPGGGGVDNGSSTTADKVMSAPLGPDGEVLIDSFILSLLDTNPFLLLKIKCEQIPDWFDLAKDKASLLIKNKIENLPSTFFNFFAIQTLNGAKGTIANMDYFAVKVSSLPKKPNSNIRFTADEFLDYIRRNMNTLVDGSTFEPYCEISSLCPQETNLWNSSDPTGALVYIDIPGDDGAVICSEFQNDYWRFKTLNAPGAGNHPVSGTREFGYEQNSDGSYNFYVRGVDRFDNNLVENAAYIRGGGNPFFGADNLWRSFQIGLEAYVNIHDGVAIKQKPQFKRPDWILLQEVLEGVKPISVLGCN